MAQKTLNLQLHRIGLLTCSECISMFDKENGNFRILWAEQGDEITLEYAGTNALKRDLVRYGKKMVTGLIKDGISAVSRYYVNNFHDGIWKDALDLSCGHYTVRRNAHSPFQQNSFGPLSL
ncbi:phosphoinositide phosphatase SAC8-like isoform X2 [Vicia villosa]|uniref:phosphoinositide phosphatase SAC8-like isoform X2 n=1 Tax=Vicia villosa TaxID=3911 RepID=UPI00273B1BAF|nr:phosphoinositide phosphatase SAC8-like isoform X2 [Vicia villosa]